MYLASNRKRPLTTKMITTGKCSFLDRPSRRCQLTVVINIDFCTSLICSLAGVLSAVGNLSAQGILIAKGKQKGLVFKKVILETCRPPALEL